MSSLSASEVSVGSRAMPQGQDVAIRVRNVDVTYRTSLQKVPTLKSAIVRLGRRERIIREVNALRDVSFDVPHGKVMGVIGANGAGKSTLMRTVAGILAPSAGRIEVNGRVSTLLALGVGFNASLSGRENVTLGGLARRPVPLRDQGEVRGDRGVRRARGLHGHADAHLQLGHVQPAGVRGRRPHGPGHPDHRRGAVGG